MNAIQTEVSDGSLVSVNVGLEYFEQSDISVFLDLSIAPLIEGTDYAWANATRIDFLTGPVAAGVAVTLVRNTENEAMLNIYDGGAPFNRFTLDENFLQLLRLSQEFSEGLGLTGLRQALDMHGYRIFNLGNPVNAQDATTKAYVDLLIQTLVESGTGPIGAASNVVYIDPEGQLKNLQQLSGLDGADLIGWDGTGLGPFLEAGYYEPQGLDLTGVVDESAVINAALVKYKRVRLPAGTIKANVLVPSGCTLRGAGKTRLNRSTKVWAAGGTTIIGSVVASNQINWTVTDMNIDGFAGGNAFGAQGPSTEFGYIGRVAMRGSDHNMILEQNGSDLAGRFGGNILVEDCDAYDGPNGFAVKMRNVTFRRCYAYDITVQGFVAVSDNINGPAIYSRAQNVRFEDCGGDSCNQGFVVYSHDFYHGNFPGSWVATVSPATDIYWDGTVTNVTSGQVHIGDFSSDGTFAIVFNNEIEIGGGHYQNSPLFGVRFDWAARPKVTGGHFSGCPNPIVRGTNVVDLKIGDGVTRFGAINPGILSERIIESSNTSAVNIQNVRQVLVFQNTVPTVVTSLVTPDTNHTIDVVIDDGVTSLQLAGILLTGRGSRARFQWSADTSTWLCLMSGSVLPPGEIAVPYALSMSADWRALANSIAMNGNINLLDVPVANIAPGTVAHLRIVNVAGGSRSVFNWSGVTWGAITPVAAIAAGATVLMTLYHNGSTWLVKSAQTF